MGTKNDLAANFSEEQMKTMGVARLKTGSDPANTKVNITYSSQT